MGHGPKEDKRELNSPKRKKKTRTRNVDYYFTPHTVITLVYTEKQTEHTRRWRKKPWVLKHKDTCRTDRKKMENVASMQMQMASKKTHEHQENSAWRARQLFENVRLHPTLRGKTSPDFIFIFSPFRHNFNS